MVSYVVCPHCQAGVGLHRIGETRRFTCDSCGKTFTADGSAFLDEGGEVGDTIH